MAIFNEILSPRFGNMVKKVFSMKNQAAARQLSGEVMPIFPLFSGAENRFLEQWSRFGVGPFVAAQGAATVGSIKITNPAGSNMIVVLEQIIFGVGAAADSFTMRRNSPPGAQFVTVISPLNFDLRDRPNSATLVSATTVGGGSGVGTTIGTSQGVANSQCSFISTDIQEIPLLPNSEFIFSQSTANQAFNAMLWWRERLLEESERQ